MPLAPLVTKGSEQLTKFPLRRQVEAKKRAALDGRIRVPEADVIMLGAAGLMLAAVRLLPRPF